MAELRAATEPLSRAAGPATRPRILCVDDEPQILASLKRQLGRHYQVLTAESGTVGLQLLEAAGDITVVLSDMRMPGMDGAEFLQKVQAQAPDTTRMLLTGETDLQSAISAVNHGGIYRFLTKPCPPEQLQQTMAEAVRHNQLINAERELLSKTTNGCIKTLSQLLALTLPATFGRAQRCRQLCLRVGQTLQLGELWPLEAAVMLLPLGLIALPDDLVDKLYHGKSLSDEEKRQLQRCPKVTAGMLDHIPRLEMVREIIAVYWNAKAQGQYAILSPERKFALTCAAILRTCMDFDVHLTRGLEPEVALTTLRGAPEKYPAPITEALTQLQGAGDAEFQWKEIPLTELRPGMILAEDLTVGSGMILLARGFELTETACERLSNLRRKLGNQNARVLVSTVEPKE